MTALGNQRESLSVVYRVSLPLGGIKENHFHLFFLLSHKTAATVPLPFPILLLFFATPTPSEENTIKCDN